MRLEGDFYDGHSSDRHRVSITRDGARLHIVGEGVVRSYDRGACRTTSPLGRMHRSLQLPDGAICELAADAPVEALLLPRQRGRLARMLHRWEGSLPLVAAAGIVTVLLVWGFIQFGIPLLARQVAFALPPSVEQTMGDEALGILDRMLLAPSALPAERQAAVRQLFQGVQQEWPEAAGYRLELRRSDRLGANALALPAGIVVVTDAFVELAQHDAEIVAVLAHEISHVARRHALRQLLQNSSAGLLVASLTGDISSVTALAATLPATLVDARYSRQFETEADDDAVAYLRRQGIAVSHFADILDRLQSSHLPQEQGGGERQSFGDLFSTHPETQKRIARILAAP
ncbi:MAG: M48 family metallopeptidase [Desulfuromonadales bacterium]|nr:M48 family metallopeptidase [Desulfuromonadales bacterium]